MVRTGTRAQGLNGWKPRQQTLGPRRGLAPQTLRRARWLVLLCGLPGLVSAALSVGEARVGFTCIGPGGIRVEGTSDELRVEETGDTLVVTAPLARLSTGIGLRDSHMHEKYLETATYPLAVLSVPRARVKFPQDGERVEATAQATLTLHGKSVPVTFHYKAARTGKAYDVQGDVHIDMNDFDITKPSYLGVTVRPGVDIAVSFRMLET